MIPDPVRDLLTPLRRIHHDPLVRPVPGVLTGLPDDR